MTLYKIDVRRYRTALRDAVELPITTRGVLYVLAQWMNADGSNGWPSLERLAASCQLRQRAVAKHLSLAVDHGYLVRTSSGHKGRTAVYQATIPEYRWDREASKLVQPLRVVEPERRPRESMHDDAAFGVKGCTGRNQSLHADDAKPAPACSPTSVTTSSSLREDQSPRSDAGASAPRSSAWHANEDHENFEDDVDEETIELIEEAVGGFEDCEETMARNMLGKHKHPQAIVNKINADRYGSQAKNPRRAS